VWKISHKWNIFKTQDKKNSPQGETVQCSEKLQEKPRATPQNQASVGMLKFMTGQIEKD